MSSKHTCANCGSEVHDSAPGRKLASANVFSCEVYRKKPECKARMRYWARLKRSYGLSKDTFEWMLKNQHHECAVCYRPLNADNIHVDHDHVTGHVRGLLCRGCNRGIGLLGDSADTLRMATHYLLAASPTQSRVRGIRC